MKGHRTNSAMVAVYLHFIFRFVSSNAQVNLNFLFLDSNKLKDVA